MFHHVKPGTFLSFLALSMLILTGMAGAATPLTVGGGWVGYYVPEGTPPIESWGNPFTYSGTGPTHIMITDAFCAGDQPALYSTGGARLAAGNPVPSGYPVCTSLSDPDEAYASTTHSHLCYNVATGSRSFNILHIAVFHSDTPTRGFVKVEAGFCEGTQEPPVAADQTVTTLEDTPLAVTLTATDPEGTALTFSLVNPPAHGTLAGTPPALTYTPALNYNGPDSFTFRASDGALNSNTATVAITVSPVNDAPVADDQAVTTPEDTPVTVTLTATDPEGSALTYAVVNDPDHGTLSGTAPALIYTPAGSYSGDDSFTFRAYDGSLYSNTATVSITVSAMNDAPVANAGPDRTVLVNDGVPFDASGSTDPDGSIVLFTWDFGDSTTGSGQTASHSYTVAGIYSVTLRVIDNEGLIGTDTAEITVQAPVQNPPVADDQAVTTLEDTPVALSLTATDPEGAALTFTVVDGPDHGALSGTPPALTYTPDSNFSGPDSFSFRANDGTLDSDTAMVAITVSPVNDAPVAADQTVTTPEDTPLGITLTATDVEGAALTYTVVDLPDHGMLSGTAPALIYTPYTNYFGPDSFTFLAYDGSLMSNTATVSITVSPVNDPPIARAVSSQKAPVKNVLVNDIVPFDGSGSMDPDGTIVSYSWDFGDSTKGYGRTTSHTYTAPGTYAVTLTVTDNGGLTGSDTMLIKVFIPGKLDVKSSPSHAKILINGKDTGKLAKWTFDRMLPGEYEVSVTLDEYTTPVAQRVTVVSGETAYLHFWLTKVKNTGKQQAYIKLR